MVNELVWPKLGERYRSALREAVAYILERYEPLGILACGTIIRGTPDKTSDLDMYVIHHAPYRQRVQRWFNGVPAEIFVNPPQWIEQYFAEEAQDRRPLTAHMLATGFVVLNRDEVVDGLIGKAKKWLATRPEPTNPTSLTFKRYMIANLYEDALDRVSQDPSTASMLLSQAVRQMLDFVFDGTTEFYPRHKALLETLMAIQPEVGQLARQFWAEVTLAERLRLAEQIADKTIGVRGFFEWETEPENWR